MSLATWDGVIWLLACFLPFLWVQRRLHREIQAFFLLLTRRPQMALGLFSLLFFPGVLLHEGSHYLTARLLGVRTGSFSLLPQALPDGRLRLGYVETAQADVLREAAIGTAPLITGALVTAWLGLGPLGLGTLPPLAFAGEWNGLWLGLKVLPHRPDFWLWFYLALTVSSTMLPSASDRRAWLPLFLGLGALVGLAVLAGAGEWMLAHLAPRLNQGLHALAGVFGISLAVHAALILPAALLRWGLSRLTGLEVR